MEFVRRTPFEQLVHVVALVLAGARTQRSFPIDVLAGTDDIQAIAPGFVIQRMQVAEKGAFGRCGHGQPQTEGEQGGERYPGNLAEHYDTSLLVLGSSPQKPRSNAPCFDGWLSTISVYTLFEPVRHR